MTKKTSIILQTSDIKDIIMDFLERKSVKGFTPNDISFEICDKFITDNSWRSIERLHVHIEQDEEV